MKRFKNDDVLNITINADWREVSKAARSFHARIERAVTGKIEIVSLAPGESVPLQKGDKVTPLISLPSPGKGFGSLPSERN